MESENFDKNQEFIKINELNKAIMHKSMPICTLLLSLKTNNEADSIIKDRE